MNHLILIGNGFDLAHGLKTRYSDFILWYLNKIISRLNDYLEYDDKLIKAEQEIPYKINNLTSYTDFKKAVKLYEIKVKYKHPFLQTLIEECSEGNWVDIEYKYYTFLIQLYKRIDVINQDNKREMISQAKHLNDSFDFLKCLLIEYLYTINNSKTDLNYEIYNHLKTILKDYSFNKSIDSIMFLDFNYTTTIEKYIEPYFQTAEINYIHGNLTANSNHIIFGYGDEIDSYYEKIEQLNSNEFLRNIKSFGYFKTKNYQNFSRFIELRDFNVYIMGHSCGLSDRILLSSIFEHQNCKEIKIYYYQMNSTENDFIEKTQEISRHFRPQFKNNMRKIIIPFDESEPLTRYKS